MSTGSPEAAVLLYNLLRAWATELSKFVTGFGKTLRMGFFQKIEFDAWLISSTIELTRVQVLGRSRTSLLRYSALFAIAPHPQ